MAPKVKEVSDSIPFSLDGTENVQGSPRTLFRPPIYDRDSLLGDVNDSKSSRLPNRHSRLDLIHKKKSTRHRFPFSSTKTSKTPPQWLHSPCIMNIFKRKFKARLESWNWENIEEEKGHTFVKWKWYQENLDSWVELISFIDWRFQFQTRRTVSKHH